ncbi:MAG: ABC transporter ATP-binding protein [Pseudomonadota bacterium]
MKTTAETRKDAPGPRSTGALAARLWREFLPPYRGAIALAALAGAVYAASASAIPLGLEWINAALGGGARATASPRDVMRVGPVLIVGLGAVNALAQYAQTRLSAGAALGVLRDLQTQMHARLVALDLAQTQAESSGRMAARFVNDPTVLRETLGRLARAVGDALTIVGLCAVLIYYDALLAAVVAVVYAAVAWPVARLGKRLRKRAAQAAAQAGDVASLVNETVAGAAVVKTYGLEGARQDAAARAFARRIDTLRAGANLRALSEPMIFFVGSVALAAVVATVAWRVSSGALDVARFISFLVALLMLSAPARGLSSLNAVAQEGFAAFDRMLSVIDARPAIVDAPDAAALSVGAGAVAFRDVRFRYPGADPPARGDGDDGADGEHAGLHGVSFDVAPGAFVALVGPSGAGKSTLLRLLARLYEPDAGAIDIDGAPIARASAASVRACLAYVGQDAFLFEGSIRDNIAVGRLDADDAAIESAARAAAAHDFITEECGGYGAPVGEGGAKLSGGQRQRIAIARAFLKDAPILLLDEATSALDAASEAQVQDAIDRLAAGRTTLVVAHRLATVRRADAIVVMDRGRIVETGDHDSLVAAGGVYARLAALQFAAGDGA